METWKPIVDFPLYEISDAGNIKRVAGWQCKTTRPRNASLNKVNGYMFATLCKDSKKYMRYVHRLVAEAFIGIPPKFTVNHKNGNKRDNRLENLEVVTQRQNNLHAYSQLNRKRPSPEHVIRNPVNGRILGVHKYSSH